MTVTDQTNATLGEIAQFFEAHDNYVLCGHVSPDGDCIGSQLALASALRVIGKSADCVLVGTEPIPGSLSFLPGAHEMVPACDYQGEPEVFVALDVPNRERIGAASELLDRCGSSVTIDHHASDTPMTDLVHVDPDSASASIIVWEVVKLLCPNPPYESALCAYTGLVTDTGGFRFQNCDSIAFAAAAELVSMGVEPGYVATSVFQNRSLASLELEALTIGRMRLFADGAGAISWISQADLERFDAVKGDVEPLIDTLREIAGVRVACMLREQDDVVRGSLRAKDDTDVSALARKLSGGGHKAAAGFTLKTPIEESVELLKREIGELLGGKQRARS